MEDYLNVVLSDEALQGLSALGLAHIGDGVYELMVRSYLVAEGKATAATLHRETIRFVSASAQEKAIAHIMSELTSEELAVFKRGRNSRVNSVPKHSDVSTYHAATGLEALFGWLYLKGRHERLNELFSAIMKGAWSDAT